MWNGDLYLHPIVPFPLSVSYIKCDLQKQDGLRN